jgi:hypothetical protein
VSELRLLFCVEKTCARFCSSSSLQSGRMFAQGKSCLRVFSASLLYKQRFAARVAKSPDCPLRGCMFFKTVSLATPFDFVA